VPVATAVSQPSRADRGRRSRQTCDGFLDGRLVDNASARTAIGTIRRLLNSEAHVLGVAIGGFTDPTFPPPIISGFEAYGAAWAMNVSELPMPHHDYDGTSHGGPRA
jgi:hypothetical protein